MASLTALAIVAAQKDAGTLETIALALAIVAFVAQVLIFIAQSITTTQQLIRSETIYDETLRALEQIQASTEGTKAAVEGQLERLLTAVLEKALPQTAAQGVDVTSPAFVAGVARDVAALLNRSTERASSVSGSDDTVEGDPWPPRVPTPNDPIIVRTLQTFPSPEESGEILDRLEALPDNELFWLRLLARDEIRYRGRPNAYYDPGAFLAVEQVPNSMELEFVAFYDPPRVNDDGDPLLVLTDEGRRHARILSARGRPPMAIADRVRALRARAEAYENELKAYEPEADDEQ